MRVLLLTQLCTHNHIIMMNTIRGFLQNEGLPFIIDVLLEKCTACTDRHGYCGFVCFFKKEKRRSDFHLNCVGGSRGYNNSGSGPAEVREQWTSQWRPDGGAVEVKRERPCTEFSSVQDGIYMLRKVHMHSIPSLRSFPSIISEPIPVVV